MADQPEATATLEPPSPELAHDSVAPAVDPLVATCPYLLAADGHWRGTTPAPEHRCTAFAPPTPLAAEKQRRLCLVEEHLTCATYAAAVAARRDRGVPTDAESPLRRELARTTPVVEVGVGFGATVTSLLSERRGLQAIPAVVLVVALIAVAASNLGRPQPGAATDATATPGLASTPTIGPAPTGTEAPTPVASEAPAATATLPPTGATAAPSAAASPAGTPVVTAPPAASREYTVRSGDTLYGIAITFNTTVAAIKELNNLTSDLLHVGQVLKIP